MQVFPFFASVLLQIELNTLKLQSIQNNTFVNKNQEPKSIFFSVFEVLTNFFFIAACNLSSSTAVFLVSLSYIGGGSSISISERLYVGEIFSLYLFKTFFNLPFAFEMRLCWATQWILTGESPMLLRVKLIFFSGGSCCKISSLMLICLVNSLSQSFLSCSHF